MDTKEFKKREHLIRYNKDGSPIKIVNEKGQTISQRKRNVREVMSSMNKQQRKDYINEQINKRNKAIQAKRDLEAKLKAQGLTPQEIAEYSTTTLVEHMKEEGQIEESFERGT